MEQRGPKRLKVPLRDRCSFGRFPWLISQALSVTYMAGEHRLYLERNCRLPESPAHSRRRNREESASSKGLKGQRGFGPAVEPRRKSRPRSTSLHGSSPCKCQRLSTLRWDRLPPSRPSTKSWARAGGRRLSDRRLHRWLAGTSASAPSSHGAADLLGWDRLNRAHICVRNQTKEQTPPNRKPPFRLEHHRRCQVDWGAAHIGTSRPIEHCLAGAIIGTSRLVSAGGESPPSRSAPRRRLGPPLEPNVSPECERNLVGN